MCCMKGTKTHEELLKEFEELRAQLEEANDTIHAIRTGQVDALVVQREDGPRLYSLKTADHTYRVFIEKMKGGAVTLNSAGVILYSNSQFASMVNLPLATVIGSCMTDFIPKESLGEYKRITEQGWNSDTRGEIFLRNRDNELIPFLLSVTSLELDEGVSLSLILTDLTLQKENEKQLQTKNKELHAARERADKLNEQLEERVRARTKDLFLSREYFRFLADNIPVIIWTADADGKLDYVNRRWVEYTGFDLEESRSKQAELVHPDDLQNGSIVWKEAVMTKRKFEREYRFKRSSDAAFRWHYAQAIPFRDDEDNITSWIGISIDIDDQKKELEKKDEFIGVASHELKTPLTSLKGYIQLLEYVENLPEEAATYISKAAASVNKLQHLIDELLDASKIEAGKLKFSKEILNLTDLVDICVENSNFMYHTRQIRKELSPGIKVCGNAERLEQVLMNLINNAVKYSPQDKEIIVRVKTDLNSAIVSVTDFGVGMPESNQRMIFERFYRVDGHETSTPGLGVGLYIASKIIQEHGGEISVKSKLHEGSEFSFSLPLVNIEPAGR
jgi:two-component system, OmpR family, phosphate regulon sensor histidine kinase PhoR